MACRGLILTFLITCFGYSAFSQINGKHVPMPKDGVLDTLLFNETTNVLTAITTLGDTFQVIIPDSTGTVEVSIAGVNIQVVENTPNDFTITDTSATYFYVDSLFGTLSTGADGTINTVTFDNPTRVLTITTTAPDTFTTTIPDSVNPFQVLSWVDATRTLSLTNGGSVVIGDEVDDADADPTNEIQNLSHVVSGTDRTINITGGTGTTFSIADSDNDPDNETNTNLVLNGTTLELTDAAGTLSQDLSSLTGGNTIYTGNGTIGGARTVTVGTNNLDFNANSGLLRYNNSSVNPGLPAAGWGFTSGTGVVGVAGNQCRMYQSQSGQTSFVSVFPTAVSMNGQGASIVLDFASSTSRMLAYAGNMRLNDAQIPTGLPGAGLYYWRIDGSTGNGNWQTAPSVVSAGNGITDNAGTFDLGGTVTGNIQWFGAHQIAWNNVTSWTASSGGNTLGVNASGVNLNNLSMPAHNKATQGVYYYNGNTYVALDAPPSGNYTLKSIGGVVQWVED